MALLGDEGREIQNRPHQEMETEMKMKNDNIFGVDMEMKGQQNEQRRARQGTETMESDSDVWEEVQKVEEIVGGENDNGIEVMGVDVISDDVGGYNKDTPPVDDVCPICFDGFTIPCRSNCGHWFCANCILQFWMFRSSVQPCKCPLCFCQIVNLKPETSQPAADDDIVRVLKKVHQYNGLYISGVLGAFYRIQALPLIMGRVCRVLIDPDGLRCIYYVMRILGLFLALLYERGEYEFVPTGGHGIQRMFDVVASLLILVLFFVGIGYRWVLRGRARRWAAIQEAWDN